MTVTELVVTEPLILRNIPAVPEWNCKEPIEPLEKSHCPCEAHSGRKKKVERGSPRH